LSEAKDFTDAEPTQTREQERRNLCPSMMF
jgi:hypothetical protein